MEETETGLTRAITLIALICFLVVGAAATSILGNDGAWVARSEMASPVVQGPVANRESKKDRLAVATATLASAALASYQPPQTVAALSEPLRQAFASADPVDIEMPKMIAAPASVPAAPPSRRLPASRQLRNPMRCSATGRSPASRSA